MFGTDSEQILCSETKPLFKNKSFVRYLYSRMSPIFAFNPNFHEKSGLIVKMAISLKLLRIKLKIWETPKKQFHDFPDPLRWAMESPA